jgi:Predicted hydrolases of HD superfamily
MNLARLKLMRSAARIGRNHTVPTIRNQSVGEHTFGVMAILFEIGQGEEGFDLDLLQAALRHDVPESITGDVPAPAKWLYPEIEFGLRAAESQIMDNFQLKGVALMPKQIRMLKFADLLELTIYSLEELDMGNRHMMVMAFNALHAIKSRELYNVTPAANDLYNEVASSYYMKAGTAVPTVDTWHGTPLVINGVNT